MSLSPSLWTIPVSDSDAAAIVSRAQVLFERLRGIVSQHQNVRFASSMAAEDMVVIDAIARTGVPISVFTLDTLRLHSQSVALIDEVSRHYGLVIERVLPDAARVDDYVQHFGVNGFYESVEAKEACCHVRKVLPLARALEGASAWVTGQRRGQGVTRSALALREFDAPRGIDKFNPLHDWSEDDVWAYIHFRHVPFNPLYREGYASIGCDPCTRPVKAGENLRAGRWWWLQEDSKECGLHVQK